MANLTLSKKQREELLHTLQARFEKNTARHKGLTWAQLQAKLEASAEKLWSLHEMERTGGEPDVVGHDKKTDEFIFYDCSRKARKAAGVSATTGKRWTQGKKTSQKATPWIWQQPWALSS